MASAFFSTLLLAIAGAYPALEKSAHGITAHTWHVTLPLLGMVLCVLWWLLVRSYRTLNTAKWEVISRLERQLPAQPYTDEWALLEPEDLRGQRTNKRRKAYVTFTHVEQLVPLAFCAGFFALGMTEAIELFDQGAAHTTCAGIAAVLIVLAALGGRVAAGPRTPAPKSPTARP